MKVLALDISSKSTGWFITKRSNGKIEPNPKLTHDQKLVVFREEVSKLLDKYKPDVVVIEDVYDRFNIGTLKLLCLFQGVAREVVSQRGIPIALMTATQARKYCCGNQGKGFKKPQVFKFFVERFGLEDWNFDEHNDITDAMALSHAYKNKKQKERKK